ncbi:DUF4913 domain-containing protein [Streptomyces sp. NPDC085612]|uniref:DUF4913 domain-containing protein n=1 Tax=Streptomyces sp. NPDC085612 TaxID=3365732 RepID=UPI0037D11450
MADDPDVPDFEVPVGLFQDLEDLKVTVASLKAQFKALREGADGGAGEAFADDDADAGEEPEEDAAQDDDEAQYPPFILLLDSPEYDDELRALIEWVEGVLVPGYLAEPSSDARWCHLWFDHSVAVARLHALWLAWQELTDPVSCGYTGPSTWHRDHLDPCLAQLRSSTGPFAGCTKGEHQIGHRMPGIVPSAWSQPED